MEGEFYADVNRRAFQKWEKEGRPSGLDQKHWFEAEHEAWSNMLAPASSLAQVLNQMRQALDNGTRQGVIRAAELGCEGMRLLLERSGFAIQVLTTNVRLEAQSPDVRTYINDDVLFADLIAVEREILLRAGLDREAAEQILPYLAGIRSEDIGDRPKELLVDAVQRTCAVRDMIRSGTPLILKPPIPHPVATHRKAGRGLWFALGGGLVAVANAAALPVLGFLGGVSAIAGVHAFGRGMMTVFASDHD